MSLPTYEIGVEFISGSFTNVASDAIRLSITRGRGDAFAPLLPGTCDILLDNYNRQYSPANAASPYAAGLTPNRAVRILAVYNTTTHHLFSGFVDGWAPEPDPSQKTTHLRATDRTKNLARRRIDLPLDIGINVGSLVANVLSASNVTASQRSIDTIRENAEFAWIRDRVMLEALQDIIQAGFYGCYVGPDGVVNVRNRYWAEDDAFGTAVASYANDFLNLQYSVDDNRVVNLARIESVPRRVSTAIQTIAWLEDRPFIPAQTAVGFTLAFLDPDTLEQGTPATSVSATSGADYIARPNSEGGGDDLTSQISVQMTVFGASSVVSVWNAGPQNVFLTKMQLRGFAIQRQPNRVIETENTSSQNVYGRRDLTVAQDLVGNDYHSLEYSRFLVRQFRDPWPVVAFGLKNQFPDVLTRGIGDIVHLVESNTAIGSRYAITAVEHDITMERGLEHVATFAVAPWRDNAFLMLDYDPAGRLNLRRLAF